MASMRRKKKPSPKTNKVIVRDLPTPERGQHDHLEFEETPKAGVYRLRVETQSILDRYLRRKQIKNMQHQAGEMFAGAWHNAAKGQRIVASYSERTEGHNDSDNPRVAHAGREVQKAIDVLNQTGPELSGVVIHVCGMDGSAGDWARSNNRPRYEGLVVLRLALNVLARHFRLIGLHQVQ